MQRLLHFILNTNGLDIRHTKHIKTQTGYIIQQSNSQYSIK